MTAYLCGGINGLSDVECRDWREVAKELLKCATLDPMRRDYRGKEDESVDAIVRGDLEDILAADYVLVNATRPSWGTAMEIVYAYMMRRPIVAFVGEARVSPWLQYHCGQIFRTLDEATAHINVAPPTRRDEEPCKCVCHTDDPYSGPLCCEHCTPVTHEGSEAHNQRNRDRRRVSAPPVHSRKGES